MKTLLNLFTILAGLGFVLSLVVHVFSLLGLPCPFGDIAWALHFGVFIVWFPSVFIMHDLSRKFKPTELWKAALRNCPPWIKYAACFFFGYAFFNFIASAVTDAMKGSAGGDGAFRLFSGHWMAFYSAALAILYSATHVQEHDRERRCPRGHPVSSSAGFCEVCGERITEPEKITPH